VIGDGWSWGGVLGGSSCYEEVGRIAKSDSFRRLCSTAITADHSARIEGENWDEIVVFVRDGPKREGFSHNPCQPRTQVDLRNFRSANSPTETKELGFGRSRPLIYNGLETIKGKVGAALFNLTQPSKYAAGTGEAEAGAAEA